MRVLHGPLNIGNQPWVLSRYERALGARSELVVIDRDWLKYPADRYIASPLRRLGFGLTAPFRYDVLHCYYGRSILSWDFRHRLPGRFADVKLSRLLGRKVFMTLQGCDVRNSARHGASVVSMCRDGGCRLVGACRAREDAHRARFKQSVLPWCDRVFALNPDLIRDVPEAVFLPYASVDVEAYQPVLPATSGPIRLLHAPTDERVKGTALLVDAVERLRSRWPIELILVSGVPHAEAVERYRQADLVVDQLLAGWYGGFAVEAMALGKPVACFLRPVDLALIPVGMRNELPIARVEPQTLAADLEALLRRRDEWPEWGRRARSYVLRWHHPRRIAAAMLRAYAHPASAFSLDELDHARCAA